MYWLAVIVDCVHDVLSQVKAVFVWFDVGLNVHPYWLVFQKIVMFNSEPSPGLIESVVMVNDDNSCDDAKHNNIEIAIKIRLNNCRSLNVILNIIIKHNNSTRFID